MKTLQEIIGAVPEYHEDDNSYTPSKASLAIMCPKTTNYDHHVYPNAYAAGDLRVLVICVDQRYLVCANDKRFRTGDHPVEVFVVLKHLYEAGFKADFATPSGQPVAFEDFAMPTEDETIMAFVELLRPQFEAPHLLADIANNLGNDSPYVAVFFPGGQGVINELPQNKDVKRITQWMIDKNHYVITICHGPSALLALNIDADPANFPFKGYEMEAFPKSGDQLGVKVGYLPGEMPWYFNDKLEALGVDLKTILPTGHARIDRNLISGDAPTGANKLGKLAAETLLARWSSS